MNAQTLAIRVVSMVMIVSNPMTPNNVIETGILLLIHMMLLLLVQEELLLFVYMTLLSLVQEELFLLVYMTLLLLV